MLTQEMVRNKLINNSKAFKMQYVASKIHMELSVGNHLLHTSFLRFPRSFIIICLLSISYYLCTSKAQTKSGNSFAFENTGFFDGTTGGKSELRIGTKQKLKKS